MSLSRMIVAGGRALVRHPLLALLLYLIQTALAAAAGLCVFSLLLRRFGRVPLFDRAVDGDWAAVVAILRSHPALVGEIASFALIFAGIYWSLSQFLQGGLIAVLADPSPSRDRREEALRFGAGGAATFLPYLRLALLASVPYFLVFILLSFGLAMTSGIAWENRTAAGIVVRALPYLAPGLIAGLFVRTATDYGRVMLSLKPGLASWRALVRGFVFAVRCPVAPFHLLVMVVIGHLGVTLLYLAASDAIGGIAGGSIVLLLCLRQIATLARFAAGVATIAGQVWLARRS